MTGHDVAGDGLGKHLVLGDLRAAYHEAARCDQAVTVAAFDYGVHERVAFQRRLPVRSEIFRFSTPFRCGMIIAANQQKLPIHCAYSHDGVRDKGFTKSSNKNRFTHRRNLTSVSTLTRAETASSPRKFDFSVTEEEAVARQPEEGFVAKVIKGRSVILSGVISENENTDTIVFTVMESLGGDGEYWLARRYVQDGSVAKLSAVHVVDSCFVQMTRLPEYLAYQAPITAVLSTATAENTRSDNLCDGVVRQITMPKSRIDMDEDVRLNASSVGNDRNTIKVQITSDAMWSDGEIHPVELCAEVDIPLTVPMPTKLVNQAVRFSDWQSLAQKGEAGEFARDLLGYFGNVTRG
jgi:hypothetical protein